MIDNKKELLEYIGNNMNFCEYLPVKSQSVPVSGKVIDKHEILNIIESAFDGHFTTGRFNKQFEKGLSKILNAKYVLTTNSGSSSNLIAFSTLKSHLLKDRALKDGDEVISVAAGFPTTVNPIIQLGCVPVFIDVEMSTYNINTDLIESAITNKTKAIFLAHTLGNPFNLRKIREVCDKYNLWLIEDCCDALGSKFDNKSVGTFGDIGTLSFYPAHHITTGEGGAVFTNNPTLKKIMESIRDWGRDCWCASGQDNTCGARFNQQHGKLPFGYDHKYVYSHLGYNLKMTDMQAAIGLAQLDKFENFTQRRKHNFNLLKEKFKESGLDRYFILPEATTNSEPSWFGFPLTIKEGVKFNKTEFTIYLTQNGIGSRMLFAGNITKQPYMQYYKYRIYGDLKNTDIIMNNTFWIGCYQGIDDQMIEYVVDVFKKFVE